MGLNLGTLNIDIKANSSDAINRIDTVKSAAEDLEKHSKVTVKVDANTSGFDSAIDDVKKTAQELSGFSGKGSFDFSASISDNATEGLNNISESFSNVFGSDGSASSVLKAFTSSKGSLGIFTSTLFNTFGRSIFGGTAGSALGNIVSSFGTAFGSTKIGSSISAFISGLTGDKSALASIEGLNTTGGTALASLGLKFRSFAGKAGPVAAVIAILNEAYKLGQKWTDDVESQAAQVVKTAETKAAAADDIITEATITGLDSKTTQIYESLNKINDVSFSTVEEAIKQLGNTTIPDALKNSSGEYATAFQTLGVSLTHPDGSEKTAAEVFNDAVEAFQAFDGDEAAKDALGYAVFGEKYSKLKPILYQTEGTLKNNTAYLEKLGVILNDDELGLLQGIQELDDWIDLAEQGITNTKSLAVAKDLTSMKEGKLLFTEAMGQGLATGMINQAIWEEAIQKYSQGWVGVVDTSKGVTDTEEFITAKWEAATKGAISDAYMESFEQNGNFYDLVAGAVYWLQTWGAEIKVMWLSLLNWIGLKDVDVEWGTWRTPDESNNDAAKKGIEDYTLEAPDGTTITVGEAIENGMLDGYEMRDVQTDVAGQYALSLFGIDYNNLDESMKQQLSGAATTYFADLADEEVAGEAWAAYVDNLFNIISGNKGNGVNWTGLSADTEEAIDYYDEDAYSRFSSGMNGTDFNETYFNSLVASLNTGMADLSTAADGMRTASEKMSEAANKMDKAAEKIPDTFTVIDDEGNILDAFETTGG